MIIDRYIREEAKGHNEITSSMVKRAEKAKDRDFAYTLNYSELSGLKMAHAKEDYFQKHYVPCVSSFGMGGLLGSCLGGVLGGLGRCPYCGK